MIERGHQTLDPRAWLLWGLAASLPALSGRNPFLLLVTLLSVVIVWMAVRPIQSSSIATPGLLKLVVLFVTIGVMFNVLTVHSGDVLLVTIPSQLPVIGGDVTLNAVVFGVLGGIAILTLVITGLTVAGSLEWSALMRLVPDAFVSIGVAGSIAFTFFPQMLASFREIREARYVRGAALRTPLDYASLASPILASGLDRAVTLSELLETRAFGSSAVPTGRARLRGITLALSLAALCSAVYLFAVGRSEASMVAALFALAAGIVVVKASPRGGVRRTRYRPAQWRGEDTIVSIGAVIAICGVVVSVIWYPEAVRYEPYPILTWPIVSVPMLIALMGLLAPVYVAGFMKVDTLIRARPLSPALSTEYAMALARGWIRGKGRTPRISSANPHQDCNVHESGERE